jgi:hypothetical protein
MDPIARVRRLAVQIEGCEEHSTEGAVRLDVGGKAFAWTLNERLEPKKPRVSVAEVLAVSCDQDRKAFLIEAAPDRFYSTPHYNGYPGVLVRLAAIDDSQLIDILHAAAERQRKPISTRKC